MSQKLIAKIRSLWRAGHNLWDISQSTEATERQVLNAVNGIGEAAKTRGRPALQKGAGNAPVVQVCMTQGQRDKLKRLGGAGWIRGKIDTAREATNV